MSENLCALEACLVRDGVVSATKLSMEKHRQHFDGARRASCWCPDSDAVWHKAVHLGDLSMRIVEYAGRAAARNLGITCGDALVELHDLTSKLYVFGGANNLSASSVISYDTFYGKWEALPHVMPEGGIDLASAVLGGHIYVCGLGLCERGGKAVSFNPHVVPQRAWKLYSLGFSRIRTATTVLAGKLYVCGGEAPCTTQAFSSVERFDPAGTGRWELLPPMNEKRVNAACAPLAGQLLVCGGALGGERYAHTIKRSAEFYNPECNKWTAAPPMTAKRVGHCSATVAGRVHVCGGYDGDNFPQALRSAEVLFPGANAWATLPPMRVGRGYAAMGVMARRLYVCGGVPAQPALGAAAPLSSAERFDPDRGIWEELPPMLTPRVGHAIGVAAVP